MSKIKSKNDTIDKMVLLIEEKLKEINKCENLNDILKQNKLIEADIDKLENKIKTVQSEMEQINDNIQNDTNNIIDDEKYQKYMLDIEKYINDFENSANLEKQIDTYKKISNKIKLCEEYLNNKKIEIVKIT